MEFGEIIASIKEKPYYLDEQADIAIYCADNRLILPQIPDKSFDLCLTDPDYNAKNIGPNEREYLNGMPALSEWDYRNWCKSWFDLVTIATNAIIEYMREVESITGTPPNPSSSSSNSINGVCV